MAVHEAPVYVPGINKLFVGVLEQGDPPVYAPNGGTYHGGLVHWGAGGGNNSIGGTEQRPGIRVLDPTTNKTTTLLNNYFGSYFNGLDNPLHTTPQLHAQTYRFPSFPPVNSGWLKISLGQPNGIAISPDAKNVYICDTIAGISGTICPHYPNIYSMLYNQTAKHTVHRYDIVDADAAPALINKRPFYYSQEWVPDGLRVAANGFVVAGVGVGMGVDVIDRTSSLVLQIRMHYIMQNFA
ncbi:hypothetical protein D6D10_06612 [Aureobasidium pullulans]|uniref:SMP-30/Gluconolactonase/LRE-like region domain-containing protein n=1 Tax=Aureobasidium pullulans TaxID=5580 RepID=A0A4S9ES04_AURPU|nr:hypothetical protein D6D10_06612 [Aureobasidium pullulans]